MRKLLRAPLLIALALFGPDVFAGNEPVSLNLNTRFEFTDCSSSGSSSQSVLPGNYVMRITDENVFVCYAATCASPNGEKWPVGTVISIKIGGGGVNPAAVTLSCRSASSTGDLILTSGS